MLELPSKPASWKSDSENFKLHHTLSDTQSRQIEAAGHHFLAHARRILYGRSFSEDERLESLRRAQEEMNDDDEGGDIEEEEETPELLELDPKEWKEQDHYAVLGISKLRYKATPNQIKTAYRRKVLKHHPDKKAAATGKTDDDSFFKCIQKAYEILSHPERRRQYDSVDRGVEDTLPPLKAKGDFFPLYRPVFEREARFSRRLPVPSLGDDNTSREDVFAFYDFWYKFDSWRSFEYLDEEDMGSAENRDDKRYIEKKNKAERARRKKEDNARIRKLVDQAVSLDPRMKKFKEEDKTAKEAKRKEREEAARLAEEKARREKEERKRAEEQAEAAAREKAANERKDRERQKKAIRKEKKVIRTIVKEQNYFLVSSPPMERIERILVELDALLDSLTLDEIEKLREKLEATPARDPLTEEAERVVTRGTLKPTVFQEFATDRIEQAKEQERKLTLQQQQDKARDKNAREWSPEEISLLIKAVNKYPGGTQQRWETIGEFVSHHSGQPLRSNEDLIKKSKEVQRGAALQEEALARLQFSKRQGGEGAITEEKSIRYDFETTGDGKMAGGGKPSAGALGEGAKKAGSEAKAPGVEKPWTAEEQGQLERALKAYPPSWKGEVDRWDKIAEGVPGRSKRECKLRVKYLAEQVKAKKARQQ
ncbi:uncharacterized protein VTP21DRAFT_164 [Calcarisporiella thermophila]|uniref:uncharacterized protein n=1 Tax=Calcarisporiella thermophila TaxID=911321 RepID=UPI003742A8F1